MNVLLCVVAAQLSRKTGGTPHSEIFWQFLHHCLDAFPECFVSLEPQSAHDGMPITGASHGTTQGNKICKSGKGKHFLWTLYIIDYWHVQSLFLFVPAISQTL